VSLTQIDTQEIETNIEHAPGRATARDAINASAEVAQRAERIGIFLNGLPSDSPAAPSAEHRWSTQMTHMTRACSMLIAAVLGLLAAAAPALAQNAPQCVVSGSPPAGWGFNSMGYIEIASGSSCLFTVNVTGEILNSSVSQNPAHGTLQQLDASSFVYTSQAGYKGSDTFSVQATGKSPTSSGASVITINATLQ
jgi:hypothetical protein